MGTTKNKNNHVDTCSIDYYFVCSVIGIKPFRGTRHKPIAVE